MKPSRPSGWLCGAALVICLSAFCGGCASTLSEEDKWLWNSSANPPPASVK